MTMMATEPPALLPPAPGRGRRRMGWAAIVGLIGWLLVSQRAELGAAGAAVAAGSLVWLAAAAMVGLLSIVNLAGLQSQTQGMLEVRRPFRRTIQLTAGAHALDLATKSGGMAGALRFGADASGHGQSAQCAAAGCLLAELCTHLGFTSMLAVVVPLAWHGRQLSGTDLAGVAVYVGVTFGLVLLVVAAARSDRMLDRLSAIPRRVRNRFARARQVDLVADRSGAAVDELRLAIDAARADLSALRRVAVHAIAWPVLGALLVAAACATVGVHLSVVAVLVTYCLTTTFAIVGFLPGGIGFAEISMGATLHAFGVDAAHTVAAVALYRLFDLWLPLAFGAVALRLGRSGTVRTEMATARR